MSFSWYMARRLYSEGSGDKRVSRSAIVIATSGVALGLAIMIISISVVLGFKSSVRDKVTGLGGHIQIVNYLSLYNFESAPIQLTDSLLQSVGSVEGVRSVMPFCQKTGMLKTDSAFQGVVFRGVDESYDLTYLRSVLVEGDLQEPFSHGEDTKRLVISSYLARQLGLGVGSRVYSYFFDGSLRARRFTVAAIYATNLSEHDRNLVFCDFQTAHQLLGYEPDQASGAEVLINSFDSLSVVSRRVSSLVNHRQDSYGAYYTTATITDLFPNIFSWLQLLDLNVVVILVLMLAVACFTTVSGLLILVLERTQFIGTMKALGATNRSLRALFIYYALLVILRGIVIGDALGVLLCLVQRHWGIIRLDPSTYYVDRVPILLDWPLTLGVSLAVLVVSVLVLVLPSYVVSHIQPAKSIRFE
ncbi:MAG: ABC transporter permease [Prevotellaceae bacterium]|nr:ABC transporter permease [Prevotellaceae bacterium]